MYQSREMCGITGRLQEESGDIAAAAAAAVVDAATV